MITLSKYIYVKLRFLHSAAKENHVFVNHSKQPILSKHSALASKMCDVIANQPQQR